MRDDSEMNAKSRKNQGMFEVNSPKKYDKFGRRIGFNKKSIHKSKMG